MPGESHGNESLAGYSPCVHKQPDMTKQLTHTRTHTHMHTYTYKMVTSLRAHTKGHLPGLLLPVRQSLGEPRLTHTSARDLSTLTGRSGSVSYVATGFFPWVLVHTRFCMCSPTVESLFSPVLWKSCNQILLGLKVRFLVGS